MASKMASNMASNTAPSCNDASNVTSDVVFARAIVAIERRDTDILFVRGGLGMHNPGNITYRNLVKLNRVKYCTYPENDKKKISVSIVTALREKKCRFLSQNKEKNWYDIGDKKAIEKVSQALREGQSELREKLRSGEITPNDVIFSGVSFDEAKCQTLIDGSQRGVPDVYAIIPHSSPPYEPSTTVQSDTFYSPIGDLHHRDIPFVSPHSLDVSDLPLPAQDLLLSMWLQEINWDSEAIESKKSSSSSEGLTVDSIPDLQSVVTEISNAEASQLPLFSDISRLESNKSGEIRGTAGDDMSMDGIIQDLDSVYFNSALQNLRNQKVPEISRISDQNNIKVMNYRNGDIEHHERQQDQPNIATNPDLSQINFSSINESQMSCVTTHSAFDLNSSILPKNMNSNEQKIESLTIRTNTDMRSTFAKIREEDTMKSNESIKYCNASDRLLVKSIPQHRSEPTEIATKDASQLSLFSDISSLESNKSEKLQGNKGDAMSFDTFKQVLDGMSFGDASQSLGSFSRISDESNSKVIDSRNRDTKLCEKKQDQPNFATNIDAMEDILTGTSPANTMDEKAIIFNKNTSSADHFTVDRIFGNRMSALSDAGGHLSETTLFSGVSGRMSGISTRLPTLSEDLDFEQMFGTELNELGSLTDEQTDLFHEEEELPQRGVAMVRTGATRTMS